MMKDLEFWNEIKGIGELDVEMELLVGMEPVLFVCVSEDNPNIKYLVMTYNSSKNTYVMRKITDKEILRMLDKEITMEETFRCGDEILKTYMMEDEIYVERYNPLEFDESMLPRKGATYNIRSQYILDYKKQLRVPKFEFNYKYKAYEVDMLDIVVDIKEEISFMGKMEYQLALSEQSNVGEFKIRKIA
ncbi:MAG: hypothetical protein IJD58_09100 [Lachnospiraceae bacterium]|nr:hypothetical protein [Lachnospiraceae bacterium]